MDYDRIKYAAYDVFEECSIDRLPFNCHDVLTFMGYTCRRYSDLEPDQTDACLSLSEDACIVGHDIYYNNNRPNRRIRFSLMHELGHLILGTDDEAEANNFASNILAPSMAVYYSGLRNVREISNLFDISLECAKYAYETCQKWVYSAKQYGMTDIDKKLYLHFYDEEASRFVFKKDHCAYCDTIIYNSNKPLCHSCEKPQQKSITFNERREDYLIAESSWLYGGI